MRDNLNPQQRAQLLSTLQYLTDKVALGHLVNDYRVNYQMYPGDEPIYGNVTSEPHLIKVRPDYQSVHLHLNFSPDTLNSDTDTKIELTTGGDQMKTATLYIINTESKAYAGTIQTVTKTEEEHVLKAAASLLTDKNYKLHSIVRMHIRGTSVFFNFYTVEIVDGTLTLVPIPEEASDENV